MNVTIKRRLDYCIVSCVEASGGSVAFASMSSTLPVHNILWDREERGPRLLMVLYSSLEVQIVEYVAGE